MALSWAFFALAIVWLLSTLNALRPVPWSFASVGTFFSGWFVSELPAVWLLLQVVATVLFAWGGALSNWPGQVGLGLAWLSWLGLVVLEISALGSFRHVDRGLALLAETLGSPAGQDHPGRPVVSWIESRIPVPRRGSSVERIRNLDYFGDGIHPHRLDLYRPAAGVDGAPVLLYIHGGAWILGDKREQGLPMMHHLARQGWVCVSANYRLSPRSTWPDHIVDCKKALAWIKESIADYGGDPARVVVSGGSAGGHLAALVALTGGDRSLQPGFEEADTSVTACIPFYGVYDFTNSGGAFSRGFVRFLERTVVKSTVAENRELFESASPYWRVHPEAPPFLVIAGRNDTLVPVREPRLFVEKLRSVSRQPVCYLEFPFAQHAFEIFPSVRCSYTIRCLERFLQLCGLMGPPDPSHRAPAPEVLVEEPAEEMSAPD